MTEPMQPVPDIEEPSDRNLTPWLIGLGGLAVIAAVLLAVKATRAPRTAITNVDDLTGDDADWRTSLRHLADAMGTRLAGIEERLDDLASERVAHVATTSVPPPPLVEQPEPSPNGPMTAHVSDTEVAPPPGPAAVSVQP